LKLKPLKKSDQKTVTTAVSLLQVMDIQNQPLKAYVKSQENLQVVNEVTKAKP
jgi:hypothetical protein